MANGVLKKIVFRVSARLCSPLCVSSGEGILTDQDVMRDYDGNPFIPGSSLAGAMRGYLGTAKEEKGIFGYSDQKKNTGEMSSLFVSDFTFTSKTALKTRDGVALSEEKTAITGAKFDMEVIETGAEGYFFLELVIREKDREEEMLAQLRRVFYGFDIHEIRLGAKKTRGYGELEILSIRGKAFSAENILEYEKAYETGEKSPELPDITEKWLREDCEEKTQYLTVKVPLRLTGGISIRQYAVKKGEPDFVHITIGDGEERRAVIPGTSFAGAIRHRMGEMLAQLGKDGKTCRSLMDDMWGYVRQEAKSAGAVQKEKDQPVARRSALVVDECILEDSKPLTMVRNGISRFEASARDGALFKERAFVGGTTTLTVRIRKQEDGGEQQILGMLLPVLQDIRSGYLPVGGQTAVGRGIFQGNGPITVDGKEWEGEYA